ncbi:hypothetical protein [Flagellimonas sp.]|jgi:hypothetical protein|uniref:hypothetical protein n=1 Tax=Flagellimonas sp. TaxID=2058762 RepID=UPI003BA95F70
MTENDHKELGKRIRQNVLDVLKLWASKDEQLEYQKNVPIADVSAELFCQWGDDFYHPETPQFRLAFNENERKVLADFDKTFNLISDKTSKNLPNIVDFVKTNEWLILNQAAVEALKKIKATDNK